MIEIVRASAERSDCHFSLINIPFGIFKSTSKDTKPVVGTAIGDYVLDLEAAAQNGLFDGTPMEHHKSVFSQDKLNKFMEVGRKNWVLTRFCIQQLILGSISIDTHGLFHLLNDVQMLMPIEVGDYTDFYSSKEHATNVGVMFRGKENALNPNWTHMPIAYHGRASSIVVSGTSTHRPSGQIKNPASASPTFGLTKKLDYELEMAFVIGKGNEIGKPISVEDAKEHIFGVVLMNDWSGRFLYSINLKMLTLLAQLVTFKLGSMYHLVHFWGKTFAQSYPLGLSLLMPLNL